MTDSRNIGQYSRFHSNPAGSGLVDGVDFPHSGLLKALSVGLQNSYAILNGTTADATKNFSIVQTNSSGNTQFVVRAGKVIRDGKLMPEIATATFTQGTPSTFDEPASGNSYFVLVVTSDSTNVLAIRGDKADTDVVPQLTAGDIPVAIIKLDTGGTVDGRSIQYLTTAKSENSVSIGYDAGSTTYTEASAITGTSEGLFISGIGTATVEGADKVLIQDTNAVGVNDVIKSVTAQSIADLAPQGDITGITAGTNLSGGGSSGAITLNVDDAFLINSGDDTTTGTITAGGFTTAGSITLGTHAFNDIDIGTEFTDADDHIMSSGAIKEKIEGYNYTTNVGDITSVVAGTGLSGGATTGDATVNLDLTDGITVSDGLTVTDATTLTLDIEEIIASDGANRVLTSDGDGTLTAETNITVDGTVISIGGSLARSVFGDAALSPDHMHTVINATGVGSAITLPTAGGLASRVFRIKNIDNAPLLINTFNAGELFEGGLPSSDSRYVSTTQLSLQPRQTVLLQAIEDTLVVPVTGAIHMGWLILDNDTYNNNAVDAAGAITAVEGESSLALSGSVTVATGQTFVSPRLPAVTSVSGTLSEGTHAGRYNICSGSVTLPSTSTAGEHYTILNTTGGDITVARNGNNINGAGSDITVATYNAVTCISIGSNNWIALGV